MPPALPEIGFDPIGRLAEAGLGVLGAVVLVLLVAAVETGFRVGLRRQRRGAPPGAQAAVGFVTTGMLGSFAFLLGIALSMASARYEQRRHAVLDEANAIGTAFLRAQAIGGPDAHSIAAALRAYVVLRHQAVAAGVAERHPARIAALQARMWAAAGRIARAAPTTISGLLLRSLNDAFDAQLVTRRDFTSHVPSYLLALLLGASLLAAGAMGYHFGLGGARDVVMTCLLLGLVTFSIVVVVDIDRPGAGGIRVSAAPLLWTAQGMGAADGGGGRLP